MPKPKQYTKPKKKPSKFRTPETEHEFLEATDELEQAGGKWRAGDTVKSARFFQRALASYDEGLQKFPESFDLMYNKALLQYEITQQPRLSSSFGSLVPLLRQTLATSQNALALDRENPDALFNTAQVLATLAQARSEMDGSDDAQNGEPSTSTDKEAIALLQEALRLFETCLEKQEAEYAQLRALGDQSRSGAGAADSTAAAAIDEDAMDATPSSPPDESEQWVTVVEPITPTAMLETVTAELSCLSTLAALCIPASRSTLAELARIATPLIDQKIPSLLAEIPLTGPDSQLPEPGSGPTLSISLTPHPAHKKSTPDAGAHPRAAAAFDAGLATATFAATLADAEYNNGFIDSAAYLDRVTRAFDGLPAGAMQYDDAIGTYAQSLVSFSNSVADAGGEPSGHAAEGEDAGRRWSALTRARGLLAGRVGTPGIAVLPVDVGFMLFRVATGWHVAEDIARQAGDVVRDVEVCCDRAIALAERYGDEEVGAEVMVKKEVAGLLREGLEQGGDPTGDRERRERVRRIGGERVRSILSDMVDDDLLQEDMEEVIFQKLVG